MARLETLLAAALRIQEAPLAPNGWARALSAIADAVDSERALLIDLDRSRGVARILADLRTAPDRLTGFMQAGAAGNVPSWSYEVTVGQVVQSSSMQSDRDFARSEFYNEAIRPLDAFYGLIAPQRRSRRRDIYITTGRVLGRDDFSSEDVAAMQALTAHVSMSLRVGEALAAAESRALAADAALNSLETGIVLVDYKAKILFANQRAEACFRPGEGMRLESAILAADEPATTTALHALIARCALSDALPDAAGGAIRLRRRARTPLELFVAPLRLRAPQAESASIAAFDAAAMILISDPERALAARRARLKARYGLTRAETDLAIEILKGDGRQAAADRLGVTLATARTHLQHIFEKTQVRRQAELVDLLWRDGLGEDARP